MTASHHTEAASLLKRQSAKRPQFFAQAGADHLFTMVMELAAELSVVRERLYAVEDCASQLGLPLSERIATWQPTGNQAAELEAMRHAMLQNLFRTIDTGDQPARYEGETADPVPPPPGTT